MSLEHIFLLKLRPLQPAPESPYASLNLQSPFNSHLKRTNQSKN